VKWEDKYGWAVGEKPVETSNQNESMISTDLGRKEDVP